MKKILGALVCMLTLAGGAMQAEATYIADWTYSLDAVKFNGSTTLDKTGSLYNHSFSQNIAANNTGNIILDGPAGGGGTVIPTSNAFLDVTSAKGTTTPSSTPVHIADFMTVTFEYSATAFDPIANKDIKISALYTVPLQYHYDGNGNEYIFYQSAPLTGNVPDLKAEGYEDGEYKYSLGEVHLFVDGNPLVAIDADSPLIPDDEKGSYVGWLINEDTRSTFLNEKGELVSKTTEGLFNIGGNFHLNYSKLGNDTTPTPEPATMLLMGAGLVGLGLVARRRNSK